MKLVPGLILCAFISLSFMQGNDLKDLLVSLDKGDPKALEGIARCGNKCLARILHGYESLGCNARLMRAKAAVSVALPKDTERISYIMGKENEPRIKMIFIKWLSRKDMPGWRDNIGERVKGLSSALYFEDYSVKKAALDALSSMDEEACAIAIARAFKKRSFPFRRKALEYLIRMRSSWRILPGIIRLVARDMPDLLPRALVSSGRRFNEDSLPWIISFLGSGDGSLRGAAWNSLFSMDRWLYAQKADSKRKELLETCLEKWPWNLDLTFYLATIEVLDIRKEKDLQVFWREMEKRIPNSEEESWVPEAWARIRMLEAVDMFLARKGGEALKLFRRAFHSACAARARAPEARQDDTMLRMKTWFQWRRNLEKPLVKEEEKFLKEKFEAQGGQMEAYIVGLINLQGRISLAAALCAYLSGHEKESREWLLQWKDVVFQLEQRWDSLRLGSFSGHDSLLRGELGVIDILDRGLGRNGRWEEGEKGYLFLMDSLSRLRPDLFLPPPPSLSGGRGFQWNPGYEEKAFSSLGLDFESFLEEAGKRELAMQLLQDMKKKLENAGLSENREMRMSVIFRLASIFSDMRKPDEADALLKEYVEYYKTRLAEIEQHPEFFSDPKAAKVWVERRLATAHVSFAVNANVLRKDPRKASYHCRKAFELDGSDFNRVLYACYLAREGNIQKARKLAESVDPQPELYYNLACTYALMGMKEKAMDFLEKDFKENYYTPRARNLHREWAMKDRDLDSLRDSERFRRLMEWEKE